MKQINSKKPIKECEKEPLSSPEVAYLTQMLRDRAGLRFSFQKSAAWESRLLPVIRENGFKDLSMLVESLRSGRVGLATQVINAMLEAHTSFFRDPQVFEVIKEVILPWFFNRYQGSSQPIRVWSAGCSLGHEPYSLAIIIKEWEDRIPLPKVEIIATDLSASFIDHAKRGLYGQNEMEGRLTPSQIARHFKQVEGDWQVDVSLRNMVKFQIFNLLDDLKPLGFFDLILCRNILKYFEPLIRLKIIKEMTQVLNPQGCMVLGGTETLLGLTGAFERMNGYRGIYRLIST